MATYVKEGYDQALGWIEVVGVVADHPPQTAFPVVRTEGDPMRVATTIRDRVLAVDRNQPVSDIKTMDAVFEATLGQRRLTMLLPGSAPACRYCRRWSESQEVRIRRALGAQHEDILRLILGQGLDLALAGGAHRSDGGVAGGLEAAARRSSDRSRWSRLC